MSFQHERYDIVLYGVSGFTGAYVLEHMVKSSQFTGISFAVAGRNEKKIRQTLAEVSQLTGKDLAHTPIILADSNKPSEIAKMAQQAKVGAFEILNF